MALDPITAAALIKGGTALAKGLFGAKAARSQKEAMSRRSAEALATAKELQEQALKQRAEYGIGPSYSELRQLVMQDPTSDYLRQQALRQEAGQVEALQAGGARAVLGGTQAVAQRSMDRLAQIAAEEQQRKARGLQVVGEAEQRVARERLSDARTDLALGRGLEAEALRQRYGAEDLGIARRQAIGEALTDVAGAGLSAYNVRGDRMGGKDPELLKLFMEKGGVMRGKTPGEFSHEENPIDIMQDGAKIGEMTGGEGIVSPEDLGKLEQLAGGGATPLHKFVRRLIKKLERNGE